MTQSSSFLEKFKGSSVLVTGSTGFIGKALIKHLIHLGAKVSCLTRSCSQHLLPHIVSTIVIDNFTSEQITLALKEHSFEYVFHLAAYGVNPQQIDPIETIKVNIESTIALISIAQHWPLKRFIYTGSCFEYGHIAPSVFANEDHALKPNTLYAASKLSAGICCTTLAKQFQIPFVWLRLFGVYGPGEAKHRLMPSLIQSLKKKQIIDLSPGEQIRDFLYIDDVITALITAATQKYFQQIVYNIASSIPVSVREITLLAAHLTNANSALLNFGANDYRTGEVMWLVGDYSAFQKETHWQPQVTLTEGITKIIQLFNEE